MLSRSETWVINQSRESGGTGESWRGLCDCYNYFVSQVSQHNTERMAGQSDSSPDQYRSWPSSGIAVRRPAQWGLSFWQGSSTTPGRRCFWPLTFGSHWHIFACQGPVAPQCNSRHADADSPNPLRTNSAFRSKAHTSYEVCALPSHASNTTGLANRPAGTGTNGTGCFDPPRGRIRSSARAQMRLYNIKPFSKNPITPRSSTRGFRGST